VLRVNRILCNILATALEFGTVSTGAAAGYVIQVLSATDSTQRSTQSTSYVTGSNTISVAITPSSASNKILVLASACCASADGSNHSFTVFRDSTNLSTNRFTYIPREDDVGDDSIQLSVCYLDSPATTSSTTYQVYFKNDNGAPYPATMLNYGSSTGHITVMEIKG
jgi:hypothetical protein